MSRLFARQRGMFDRTFRFSSRMFRYPIARRRLSRGSVDFMPHVADFRATKAYVAPHIGDFLAEVRTSRVTLRISSRKFEYPIEHRRLPRDKGTCSIAFYAFSADATQLWHKELSDYGRDVPRASLIGDAFYI